MNLLGFFAIVITVAGILWLLQLFLNGRVRININLSLGGLSELNNDDPTTGVNRILLGPIVSDSILGKVVLTGTAKAQQTAQLKATSPEPISRADLPDQHSKNVEGTRSVDPLTDDSFIDQALADEILENYTSESILKEDVEGIHSPPSDKSHYPRLPSLRINFQPIVSPSPKRQNKLRLCSAYSGKARSVLRSK